MQLRPDAPWLIVPATLLALARPPDAPRRARLPSPTAAACALLFVMINAAPTLWALSGHVEGSHMAQHFVLTGTLIGSPWADPDMTPRALAALVVFGAGVVIFRHRKMELLWLAATMVALPLDAPATGRFADLLSHRGHAFAIPMAAPVLQQQDKTTFHQYANARYHIPAMHLACGLAGAGTAGLLGLLAWLSRRRVPAARLVAAGVVCAAALPGVDLLHRMWTPQREFELFRANVSRLDPQCQVVTMIDVRDAGFVPFEYLSTGKVVDAAAFLAQPDTDDCTFYYRAGNCFTHDLVPNSDWPGFEVNPVCRSLEQRFELIPIAERAVAAVPYRGEVYARDPLPLGFYRLQPKATGPPHEAAAP